MTKRYLTKEEQETLIDALERIKGGERRGFRGICGSLEAILVDLSEDDSGVFDWFPPVEVFSKGWEHHSGSERYPVSGLFNYQHNTRQGTLWVGEQLELRMDLLDYLINQVLIWGTTTLVDADSD